MTLSFSLVPIWNFYNLYGGTKAGRKITAYGCSFLWSLGRWIEPWIKLYSITEAQVILCTAGCVWHSRWCLLWPACPFHHEVKSLRDKDGKNVFSFPQGITTSQDTAYLPFAFSTQLLSFHPLLLYSDENVSLVSTWPLRDISGWLWLPIPP